MTFITLHSLSGSCHKVPLRRFLTRCYTQNAPKLTPTKRPVRPAVRSSSEESGGSVLKWLLLVFPAGGVALGTWQWQRKQWKAQLIADLGSKTQSAPIPFPSDLDDLKLLEYRPLTVTGEFLHDRELIMEPRPLLKKDDGPGGLVSSKSQSGAQVITPFKVKDRELIIMVNRGWVSRPMKQPEARQAGQIEGEVTLDGILRHTEKRPPMNPKNRPEQGQWFYKDLDEMGAAVGATPILLDATEATTVPGGPIGGQTRVSLRDEHLSYMITWYSLAAITTYMWYVRFFKKPAIIR